MINIFFRLTLAFMVLSAAAFSINAQVNMPDASTVDGKAKFDKEDFPKNIKESLAKRRIENEKKDFEELVQRGEETLKLTEELKKSFAETGKFSAEDQKKLERLEKLAKRICKDLGADSADDSENEDKPFSKLKIIEALQSGSAQLFEELKKASPYSISVSAIQSSNLLLKMIRFLRFGTD